MCKKLIYLTALVLMLSMVLAGTASTADHSLVAWYRFDGDATDISGNNLHGTEMGDPTYEAGVFGRAIRLDGNGDYVDCGLAPEFNITDYITFTYWIKVVEFDKGWNTVLSKGDDSWRSSRAAWNNFMEAAVTGTTGDYTYGVTPVDDGQWHHVGFVYDGMMNCLYVDGEVDASEPSTGQINVSSYPLWIGENSQFPGSCWNGLIDDVQIYNRALSQEEIQTIMKGEFPSDYTPKYFEITYYDNYNYDTGQWDAWQSDATLRDAWDDKYLADDSSGKTVFTDHAFPSIAVFDLKGNLFSKDGHASGGEDWNPLKSIGDNVSGQSAHHVFAALFKGLVYLEEGDVLTVTSDDDVYVFLDDNTQWGQEVLSIPYISFFDTDSTIVTAAQAGYHMMTVKFIERLNSHSGIEVTLNGVPIRSAKVEYFVTVPGTACCFFAGQDQAYLQRNFPPRVGTGDHDNLHNDTAFIANSMPPSIEVYGDSTLSISASGVWGHCPGCTSGPDGYDIPDWTPTHDEYVRLGGISRVTANRNTLLGVFLTDDPPDPGAMPPELTSPTTTPLLQQAFPIGTSLDNITIPEGATRLFFGLNDGYEWNNNVGSLEVAIDFPPVGPQPPDEGFDIYLDDIAPGIIESSMISNGLLDFYYGYNPASGDFCIHWTGVDQYNNISFQFSPTKDLSMMVDEGYVVDFWVRCSSPDTRFDIGFVDTKTDSEDHPWQNRFKIDRNVAVWDGRWNNLQIPLNSFYMHGSWDNDRWWEPVGDFEWTATEYFLIVAEDSDLVGIHFYFDDIRVVECF